jgi:RecB family endonuclease NucS
MKDVFVKDWNTAQIDLRDKKVVEMKPTEIHHKADGDTKDGPSFAIVMTRPDMAEAVVAQISFNMLPCANWDII